MLWDRPRTKEGPPFQDSVGNLQQQVKTKQNKMKTPWYKSHLWAAIFPDRGRKALLYAPLPAVLAKRELQSHVLIYFSLGSAGVLSNSWAQSRETSFPCTAVAQHQTWQQKVEQHASVLLLPASESESGQCVGQRTDSLHPAALGVWGISPWATLTHSTWARLIHRLWGLTPEAAHKKNLLLP